jgi:hypothetical protein
VPLVRHHTAPVKGGLLAEPRRIQKKLGMGDGIAPIDAREVAPVVATLLSISKS